MKTVLVLVGPTAIGKTALSLELAEAFQCEIVSMDSMQVYRGMDIGTAKATAKEQSMARHHLLDIVDPDEQYSAARFVADAEAAMQNIWSRGKVPLLVGGTGLYLKALECGLFAVPEIPTELRAELRARLEKEGRARLYEELSTCDPASAARIAEGDTQRILRGLEIFLATGMPWSEHLATQARAQKGKVNVAPMLKLALGCERTLLYKRINGRSASMMGIDFRREVEGLLAKGYSPNLPSMQSLGYRHMLAHMDGLWSLDEATEILARDTRRYAKRQLTWFRSIPELHWFDRDESGDLLPLVNNFLQSPPQTLQNSWATRIYH